MSEQFPRDTWYAIGGSATLGIRDVAPVQLFGEERVAWRGADAECHVWHNQCIHRGMRLQYGYVDGDRLSCRYHGWRFAGDGKCAYIPAHPDMTPPDDFCVPTYPSREGTGLIWSAADAVTDAPPDLSHLGELVFCRSAAVNAAPELVLAAAARATFAPLSDPGYEGPCDARPVATGVVSLSVSAGASEDMVVVAVQPVSAEKSQIHVLGVSAGADETSLRLHLSAWTRQFRSTVEREAAAQAIGSSAV